MQIRDRIRELRRVKVSDLRPNPRNWRVHPERQQNALRAVLAEIGYVDALLARECEDGTLELIDGHLRAETTPDQLVPVLILDVDENEAGKVLATFDPLAALAETDTQKLSELAKGLDFASDSLSQMLRDLTGSMLPGADANGTDNTQCAAADESHQLTEKYSILIECNDESQQSALLARLSDEGYKCRALIA